MKTKLYLVILTYVVPLETIDALAEAHGKFLDKYYGLRKFVFSGRQNPRVGGVILCTEESVESVDTILKEDPFRINGAAEYKIIEVQPTKYSSAFKSVLDSFDQE